MFDIGFWELVLLFVIGLLVLGPQRLPKVAADLGKWVGRARRTANELRRQLEREIELSEITRPPPPPPPRPNDPQPPGAEPQAPEAPDPYTPEMQHGQAPPAAAAPEQNPYAQPPVEDAAPPAEPVPVGSAPSVDTTDPSIRP